MEESEFKNGMCIRPREWTKEESEKIASYIKTLNRNRTLKQKLKTKYLSIKYRLEDFFRKWNRS